MAVVARSPSQSPKDEKTMAFQSLRNAGIERTLRVTACAGAAGVGRLFGTTEVYRALVVCLKVAKKGSEVGFKA